MINQLKLGTPLAVIGISLLAWQWLNVPIQIPTSGRPFTETELRRWEIAENENKQHQLDIRAAESVLQRFGCANVFGGDVANFAKANRLSPRLVAATIVAESSCRTSAISKDGAVGLMQVDLHTWRTYSRTELLNPARNIEIGTTILARYVRETGSNREGLRRYFGVTPGSDQADLYADKILAIARLN
jgi:soluble lytic murein transglycosylase-like protein